MIRVRLRLWTQLPSRTPTLPIPSLMTMGMDRMNTTPLDLEVRPGSEDIRSQFPQQSSVDPGATTPMTLHLQIYKLQTRDFVTHRLRLQS